MDISITPDLLKNLYRFSKEQDRMKSAPWLQIAVIRFNVNTKNRLRAFFSIIGHETGHLKVLVENLNYSAKGLMSTWPSRFKTIGFAEQYARNPQKTANYVYGGRYGNTEPGDGWKYRGRGAIQTTFKDNYSQLNNMYGLPMGVDFTISPELLEDWQYAARSAGYYWEKNGVNALADKLGGFDDYERFKAVVKRVNGGYIGLAGRWELYQISKSVII